MRILITGAGGFVAGHLAKELRQHGHDAWGAGAKASVCPQLAPGHAINGNLLDEAVLREAFGQSRPDAVIHLAAQSNPARSWEIPAETFESNVQLTIGIVRAAAAQASIPRIVHISSSDVYGLPDPRELPLSEDAPLRPANPYAVSKVAAEQCARLYANRLGVQLVVLRPFSHTGPGQTDNFVVPAFARQIARIEAGQQSVLAHGDLDASRDFTDVRDIVRAYRLVAECAHSAGVYNVCSGRSVHISDLLAMLCSLSTERIVTWADPARIRGEKSPEMRGTASRLHAATGWEPRIELRDTLHAVLADQRNTLGAIAGTTVP